jgi:hypothetical protein
VARHHPADQEIVVAVFLPIAEVVRQPRLGFAGGAPFH